MYEDIVVGGGVSPDHFFYKMTWGEVAACLRGLSSRERVEWERVRRIMWAALKPHSKNIKKYRDVMPLPWDDEKKEVENRNTEVDERELERIRKLSKRIKL